MTDFYRRNLPHWHPEGAMYFITFRLANSPPIQVVQGLREQRRYDAQAIRAKFAGAQQRDELYMLDKKYFGYFDEWLDRCVEESPRRPLSPNAGEGENSFQVNDFSPPSLSHVFGREKGAGGLSEGQDRAGYLTWFACTRIR